MQRCFCAVIFQKPGEVEGFSLEKVAGRVYLFLSFPHHLISPWSQLAAGLNGLCWAQLNKCLEPCWSFCSAAQFSGVTSSTGVSEGSSPLGCKGRTQAKEFVRERISLLNKQKLLFQPGNSLQSLWGFVYLYFFFNSFHVFPGPNRAALSLFSSHFPKEVMVTLPVQLPFPMVDSPFTPLLLFLPHFPLRPMHFLPEISPALRAYL